MKTISVLLLFCLIQNILFSQSYTIQSCFNNQVYFGLDNELKVFVEGFKFSSIILKATNGDSVFPQDNSHFIFQPAKKEGVSELQIFVIKDGHQKKIGTQYLQVIKIPDPQAVVAEINGGNISRDAFVSQFGVGVRNKDSRIAHFENRRVQSFRMIVMRNDEILFSEKNTGNEFTENLQVLMKQLKKDDKVILVDIIANSFTNDILLQPVEFILTD
jgi:hypothetical protein